MSNIQSINSCNKNKPSKENLKINLKIKNINFLPTAFSDMKSNFYHYLSEKRKKGNYSRSNHKDRKSLNNSKNNNKHTHFHNDSNPHFHNDNIINTTYNIQQKNFTNYFSKTAKLIKEPHSKKIFSAAKLQINKNINNYNIVHTDNNITNITNNIMNFFGNYNIAKGGLSMKLSFKNKNITKKIKKINSSKKTSKSKEEIENLRKSAKKTQKNNKSLTHIKHSSEPKLIRSSSLYSFGNNVVQTNSFINENIKKNPLEYTSGGIISKKFNNKGNKSLDLNGLFQLQLSPSMSPHNMHNINNIQDYLKYLYKHCGKKEKKFLKKGSNNIVKKKKIITEPKEKKYKTKIKHDEVVHKKNTSRSNDISNNDKIIEENYESNNDYYYCDRCGEKSENVDGPEELHFFYVNTIQNGKKLENTFINK